MVQMAINKEGANSHWCFLQPSVPASDRAR